MRGPYNIPRNYKGEDKILFIFSRKAFLYTAISGGVGVIFYYLFKTLNIKYIGTILLILFAFLGFAIATFKIPETQRFKLTQKIGGEAIDDIILRYIKFKRKNSRIYIYKEGESKDDDK